MKTYSIALEGQHERQSDIPKLTINSLADSAVQACEAARTIVSAFTHHEYISVHWRISPREHDSADLEINYKNKQGEFHREIFGHCEPIRDVSNDEMPRLRLVASR